MTPSGIEIYYQSKPNRLYRVRPGEETDWIEVPSVTTVLDVLSKDALTWWGQGVALEGVCELVRNGLLDIGFDPEDHDKRGLITAQHALADRGVMWADKANLEELLKLNHLTVNQVRDKAADRGVDVHDALETWAKTGVPPTPEGFPVAQQGYVRGLQAALIDLGDAVEPIDFEVMVASYKHRFAGRYDMRLRLTAPRRVVVKITDSRLPRYTKYATIPAGVGIIDLKTSKYIYDSHYLQMEGYEGASTEDGYEPTDWRAVLHVTADGYYELAPSRASFQDFLNVVTMHDTMERVHALHTATARNQ